MGKYRLTGRIIRSGNETVSSVRFRPPDESRVKYHENNRRRALPGPRERPCHDIMLNVYGPESSCGPRGERVPLPEKLPTRERLEGVGDCLSTGPVDLLDTKSIRECNPHSYIGSHSLTPVNATGRGMDEDHSRC